MKKDYRNGVQDAIILVDRYLYMASCTRTDAIRVTEKNVLQRLRDKIMLLVDEDNFYPLTRQREIENRLDLLESTIKDLLDNNKVYNEKT